MESLKEQLDQLRMAPVRSPEDARLAEEATRLLGAMIELEQRAQRLVEAATGEEEEPSSLAGLTLHEAARLVLQRAGTPLHARELGARIKAGGWRHPRSLNAQPGQIVFQLAARLPRHPDVFRRVAPNTFALVEWGDEPFGKRGPAPRLGLFGGPGRPIGRMIGESDEPQSQGWRSS